VPKNVFGGFWGWRCENIVFWPPKGTTMREYASVDVSRVKIGSTAWALGPWKDFAYEERNFKKMSGNFGYMGRSYPWGDQMWRVGRCGGRTTVWPCDGVVIMSCGHFNPLESRGNYSATSNNMKLVGTLAVDGWAVTFDASKRGLGGAPSCPGPSSLYQMQQPTYQRPVYRSPYCCIIALQF